KETRVNSRPSVATQLLILTVVGGEWVITIQLNLLKPTQRLKVQSFVVSQAPQD
ncbi:MAG: hypothetical protein RLZZ115_3286, partial [Cyanobacteriota bacterium]